MSANDKPVAVDALDVPPRQPQVRAPAELIPRFAGRLKRTLGERFGLTNFGVNIVQLEPGAISSLRHAHSSQDEIVYVIQGRPTLVTNEGETVLEPGMCAGFKAGSENAHHLINRTNSEAIFLEAGDRTLPDEVAYPDDDLSISVDATGKVDFRHKDGKRYE